MKITVSNLSSNPLAVPSPINVMLGGGKSATVVLKDQDWKAAQSNAGIQRLLSLKMLALTVLDQPAAAPAPVKAAPAPAPAPKAPEPAPAPAPEPEAAAAPAAEPEATEPAAEPAPEAAADAADEPKAGSKKKKKSSSTW